MSVNPDQLYETPQQARASIAAKRAETRAIGRVNKEKRQRTVLLCPSCGYVCDVHGRYSHETARYWPCQRCNYGAGEPVPTLLYQDPMSGLVRTAEQLKQWLDS